MTTITKPVVTAAQLKEMLIEAKGARLDMTDRDFTGQDFSNMVLSNVDFTGSTFKGAQFSLTHISNCKFSTVNFHGAKFVSMLVHDSSFDQSDFSLTTFSGNDIFDSSFRNAQFDMVKFRTGCFDNCDFSESRLFSCQMRGTSLSNTNLSQIMIVGTTFFEVSGLTIVSVMMGKIAFHAVPTPKGWWIHSDLINGSLDFLMESQVGLDLGFPFFLEMVKSVSRQKACKDQMARLANRWK